MADKTKCIICDGTGELQSKSTGMYYTCMYCHGEGYTFSCKYNPFSGECSLCEEPWCPSYDNY